MKKLISALLIGATLAMPMNMALCSADEETNVTQSMTSANKKNEQEVCSDSKDSHQKQMVAKVKERLLIAAVVILGALYLYEKSNNNSFLKKVKKEGEQTVSSFLKKVRKEGEQTVSSLSKRWNQVKIESLKYDLNECKMDLNECKTNLAGAKEKKDFTTNEVNELIRKANSNYENINASLTEKIKGFRERIKNRLESNIDSVDDWDNYLRNLLEELD